MDTRWLRRHQVAVYAAAVVLAIATAVGQPGSSTLLQRLIEPVLAVLLYVTFLEVPFTRLRDAVSNGRFLAATLGTNFLVVPFVVWGLTRVLPADPEILVGASMVLLTPCIDYVITFTAMADGDAEQVTATTPALLLVQLLLLPVYLWILVGPAVARAIDAEPFLRAFLVLIVVPLTLAWLTEAWAEGSPTGREWRAAMGWLSIPALGLTLFVVIASQLPRVGDSIGRIAAVVPVYVGFLVVMPLIARVAAGIFRLDLGESRALVFTTVTRNSLVVLPLALALPAGYELVPTVVVTQTLVELAGMMILTRVVPAWLLPVAPTPIGGGAS
jgi:ACR3 family arsenite efflux pump ArsB